MNETKLTDFSEPQLRLLLSGLAHKEASIKKMNAKTKDDIELLTTQLINAIVEVKYREKVKSN